MPRQVGRAREYFPAESVRAYVFTSVRGNKAPEVGGKQHSTALPARVALLAFAQEALREGRGRDPEVEHRRDRTQAISGHVQGSERLQLVGHVPHGRQLHVREETREIRLL